MIPDRRWPQLHVAPEARGANARAWAAAYDLPPAGPGAAERAVECEQQPDVAALRARVAETLEAYARAAQALAVATTADVDVEAAYRARQEARAQVVGALLALFFAVADEREMAPAVAQQVDDVRRHPLSCEHAQTWAREYREAIRG